MLGRHLCNLTIDRLEENVGNVGKLWIYAYLPYLHRL